MHGPPLPPLDSVEIVDQRTKGIPGGIEPFPLGDIGAKGWNVLAGDLPLPVAVLKLSALDHNSRWMTEFLNHWGVAICPHGKTSMSPQLFARQIEDGAWGITVATVNQLQVCRAHGFRRVLLANQLVGAQAIRYVVDELATDSSFEFLCLVDSVDEVSQIAEAVRNRAPARPLEVLLEGGYAGGRTGCRDLETALAVAVAVKEAEPHLALRGVEGFEGLIDEASPGLRDERIARFIDFLCDIATACADRGLFAEGPVILSAGGSAFYDIVVKRFAAAGLDRDLRVVTRSGCYLTHDSQLYKTLFHQLVERSPDVGALEDGLRPALDIWGYVQSLPEPGLAIATMGKRDCSYDAELPTPTLWFRAGEHAEPAELGSGYEVTRLDDQHAHLRVPTPCPLRFGDMVAFGISHPSTTFDKWRLIPVVSDRYDVVSAIKTFF